MTLAALLLAASLGCPAARAAPGQPGTAAVAKLPAAEAMQLNREGKRLYRQEKWAEARAKYRAALAADPDLLAASLNVACSLSRQGRYQEAAAEAASLIRKAYVPWNREVEEAADLGILPDYAAYAKVVAARKAAAVAWGTEVRKGVLFVARTRPPVNVAGEGVLVLRLNQEVFSWNPETGRFLQVSAEDGRVLAFAVSPDRARVAYLLAGKVVRSPGHPDVLRGLALRVLELSTMALGPRVPLPTDVVRAELWFAAQPRLGLKDAAGSTSAWTLGPDGLLASRDAARPQPGEAVVLAGRGVAPTPPQIRSGRCGFSLRMRKSGGGIWRIEVAPRGGKRFALDARYGAGLLGLPFPEDERTGSATESERNQQ